MLMWSLASLQRPSRMYALPRYTILHILTITVSNSLTPNGLWYKRTSTLLSEIPNVMVPRTYTPVTYLRTASVCFIQEEPHNMRCILDRGRILLLL